MWGIINFTNVMFNESMGMRGERCRKKLEEIISSKLPKFDEKVTFTSKKLNKLHAK